MTYSRQTLVKIGDIVAEVKLNLGDDEGVLFTPGWYVARVQGALRELSFDGVFFHQEKDIDLKDLTFEVPENCWDIEELYVYNTDNECNITEIHEVYWKDHFKPNKRGNGYTAYTTNRVIRQGSDILNPNPIINESGIYYFNESDGYIFLSSTCSNFSKAKVIYKGVFTPLGETPLVPEQLVEGVVSYVTEKGLKVLKARDLKYRALWNDEYTTLYGRGGLWDKTVRRARRVDRKKIKDLLQYQNKINS